jgi:hypothetical protein
MIKAGEKGLRINAFFESVKAKEREEDEPPLPPSKRKLEVKGKSKFRKVSVFDISQTRPMDGVDEPEPPRLAPAGNVLAAPLPQGDVPGYDDLLRDLREASPLPIIFSDSIEESARAMLFDIAIKEGMSQLNTIRAVIFQIALLWLRAHFTEPKLLEVAARSVTFIVSQHLDIDASGFGFCEVSEYNTDREQDGKEGFLDAVQKTALYFIDTLDGIRAARQLGYPTDEYFMLTNQKTALRLFRQGHYVYLVYPGQGELLAMSKKVLEQYEGPFAVPREGWFGVSETEDKIAA